MKTIEQLDADLSQTQEKLVKALKEIMSFYTTKKALGNFSWRERDTIIPQIAQQALNELEAE